MKYVGDEGMQRYFDDAVAYLATMTRRSVMKNVSEDGTIVSGCTYFNTETDEHCIIGQFIPDGHVAQGAYGGVRSLYATYPDLLGIAIPDHEHGLEVAAFLQVAHDDADNWTRKGFRRWERVAAIADKFNLTFTMPETVITDSESLTVV